MHWQSACVSFYWKRSAAHSHFEFRWSWGWIVVEKNNHKLRFRLARLYPFGVDVWVFPVNTIVNLIFHKLIGHIKLTHTSNWTVRATHYIEFFVFKPNHVNGFGAFLLILVALRHSALSGIRLTAWRSFGSRSGFAQSFCWRRNAYTFQTTQRFKSRPPWHVIKIRLVSLNES